MSAATKKFQVMENGVGTSKLLQKQPVRHGGSCAIQRHLTQNALFVLFTSPQPLL
jgi:hypothetical protein